MPFAYNSYGSLLIQTHAWNQAHEIITKAITISKECQDEVKQMESLIAMGRCYLEQGQFQAATSLFEQAKLLAKKHRLFTTEFDIVTDLATCYEGLKDYNKFQEYLDKMYRIRKQLKRGV